MNPHQNTRPFWDDTADRFMAGHELQAVTPSRMQITAEARTKRARANKRARKARRRNRA